jgi:O-antigen/teichoic acid export membrane protein
VPLGDIGIYGFGYNLGNLQQVVANSGNSVLMPRYGRVQIDPQSRNELPKYFHTYVAWMAAAALAISIFSDEFIDLFMPTSFAGAGAIVPWVALGFFCVALYYGPMNSITLIAGKTRWVWIFTFAAGAVNIMANLLFVPIFGILAAAVDTLLGYFILFLLISLYGKRFDLPKYSWAKIGFVCLGLVIAIIVDRLLLFPAWLDFITDGLMLIGFILAFTINRADN